MPMAQSIEIERNRRSMISLFFQYWDFIPRLVEWGASLFCILLDQKLLIVFSLYKSNFCREHSTCTVQYNFFSEHSGIIKARYCHTLYVYIFKIETAYN